LTYSEKLDAALRTALDLPEDMELAGIAYGRTEGWDSVAHMQLVAAVENAFGIMLETEDVIAMSDYDAICRILRDHHDVAVDA
jgi:acyl carrier protein